MICSICGNRNGIETITVDNGAGEAMGIKDGTQFHYCGPCWRTLQDKSLAASMLQGQTLEMLRAMGHPAPERVAQGLHDYLMKAGKPTV